MGPCTNKWVASDWSKVSTVQTGDEKRFTDLYLHIRVVKHVKGVINCQNSRDKGPPEGNSARG